VDREHLFENQLKEGELRIIRSLL